MILNFKKNKKQQQKKTEIGIATKLNFLVRKTTQFISDHDYAIGNVDTLLGIQERALRFLDSKIKTVNDIDKLYNYAINNVVSIKRRNK